jgi:hypothetical protein
VILEEQVNIIISNRKPEDRKPPVIFGRPSGAPVSENMAVKIYQSYMQEPIIDSFFLGLLRLWKR